MITVVIIDDDPFVTTSLQTILESTEEIRVLGIGHFAKDAIDLYETHRPDVLLTDIRMPEQTGIDAAKEILAKFPHAILLLLTTFKDEEYIREAFSIGVKGYLIKQNLQAIIPSVKASYNGQVVFGNEIVETFTQLMKNEPSIDNQASFSEREFAIIKEVAAGKNNKEIADALYLSDGTVRNYISQLLEKLGLRDRTQLAIYFYQHLQ
ncbi:response regulator transcription factor [Enterococcus casseliflavus]|uniref:response regulator transcription factor n=1 Tax=Enterococcus sp. 8E11_MSG4843 TaxID=1834190 RepID=UPI000B3EBF79|nr:response regulator transcription factor [Enterococcus sp. 8E11_MSG4843]MBO1096737.1 response regulator transcription factor [Enterococcus casseliflavus]MBO1145060.1 response regulator transcription factor [Enterococcus casseliflavus]OUZ36792.1 LuxR family DNA-binding response regulator [Enterococcus sp. 8E11_MSG4843]